MHRWEILRSPLNIHLSKIPALMMCLSRLHSFCIDFNAFLCGKVDDAYWTHIHCEVKRYPEEEKGDASVVMLLKKGGRPDLLLDHRQYYFEAEYNRFADINTTKDEMIQLVKESNFQRRNERLIRCLLA